MKCDRFVIFLDFDGVLANKFSSRSERHPGPSFDPLCMETLKSLIAALKKDVKTVIIIVTSHWRYDMANDEIRRCLLHHYGLKSFPIEIQFTELLGNKRTEIDKYILEHQLPAETYLILDDEDLGPGLAIRQIRTRYEDGLRGIDVDQVLDLIKKGHAP